MTTSADKIPSGVGAPSPSGSASGSGGVVVGGGAGGGGIAWSGSLVGCRNPSNLGYRYSHPHKRYRRAGSGGGDGSGGGGGVDDDVPGSVLVQFRNRDGADVGDAMDLPTDGSDADAMGGLVHALLHPDEDDNNASSDGARVPYGFYASVRRGDGSGEEDEVEVTGTLADLIRSEGLGTEEVLKLTYQPLAVLRVRPVTRCTDTMPGHTEAVLHVSYSPDGRHLASGGGDATVRFWDVNTSLPRHTCRAHKDHVLCTAWSPDGRRFASSDKRGVLITWDPSSGRALTTIRAHGRWITSVCWEPMHRSGGGGSCERLATAGKDGLAKVWNVRTGRCEATLSGHADSVECVIWGGEGLIYTASRDRTVKVWGAEEREAGDGGVGKLVRTLTGHGHRVNTLALSCDYVCRTGPFDQRCEKFPTDGEALAAAEGKYREFKGTAEPERLVSGSDDFTLFLWHPTESKHPVKRLMGHQQLVNHIAFSPDGRYFASASFDRKVKVWNGRSGDFICTLTGHVGAVYRVAWSSDSRFLVSASKDSTAKLWEVPGGKRARETLPGHADEVYALDWSSNGSSVATGSKDRTIKIWKH